jgi:hypothetical protein
MAILRHRLPGGWLQWVRDIEMDSLPGWPELRLF